MQELLRRIQFEDDQQAFRELYHLLFFKLYQFAYAYLKSKENAEEIVNDVFLGLWQKRKTLDTISNFNVYLYVAVKNASLNFLRKCKRSTGSVPMDELNVNHLHLSVNPENLMISHEMERHVREAIDQLPSRCKLIFKLVKDDGLSYKEAASVLDVSVKTIDTQLYLALKKLAVLLLPVWEEYKGVLPTSISQKKD